MELTRREFLGAAAVTAATMAGPSRMLRRRPTSGANSCQLLDLGEHCGLRESVAGFEAVLAAERPAAATQVIVVPAALAIPRPTARLLVRHIAGGGRLILESGAGFAAPTGPAFRAHRDLLRDCFDLDVGRPRRLAGRRVPYVEYRWPSRALVRDFSCIVPVNAREGEAIARIDGATVGLARRVGSATLIFLGSPLGPALWAGDAEARRWLLETIAGRSPSATEVAARRE
jgi:hypothetical protein